MEKDRGFRTLAIAAICVAVVALSIGYAALSQTLTINGQTTVKGNTWDIVFENLTPPTLENGGLVGSATEKDNNMNTTTFSFDINLVYPGDTVVYKWDVANNGTIDAKLASIPVLNGLDPATAANVSYTFKYQDNSDFAVGDTLRQGNSDHLVLTIKFNDDATAVPNQDLKLSLSTTLTYVQA